MKELINYLPEERRVEALTEKDNWGCTAVHWVTKNGSAEVVILNLITHIIMVACAYTLM